MINKTISFVSPSPVTMAKLYEKRNVEIIFSNFVQNHYHYGKGKYCSNVDFEEMDTECSTGKIIYFEYCEEYLRSTSSKILL